MGHIYIPLNTFIGKFNVSFVGRNPPIHVATNEGQTEGFKIRNGTMQEEVQVRYSRKADESLTYEEIPIQVGVTRNKIFVQIL